ncbi:hypothetical protein [Kitasatospora sp. NPDC091207]|uniref:hypothetical protein n=1 Tax=Kitasatospora sp. NPDC091207 TaxID=3364083 RepID=UPI0037FEC9D8
MKDRPARSSHLALLFLVSVVGCSAPTGGSHNASSDFRPVASGEAVGHTWELLRGENGDGVSCLKVKVDQTESSADCGMSVEVAPFNVAVQRFADGSTAAFGIARKELAAVLVERRGVTEYVSTIGSQSAGGPNYVVVIGAVGNPIGNISSKGPDGREYSIKDKMDEVNSEGA